MSEEKTALPPTDNVERIEKLTPPKESHLSTILNGIGNGAMIGTMPFVLHSAARKITGREEVFGISRKAAGIVEAFAMVTGCTVGAVLGMNEAKNLDAYRAGLNSEMAKTRAQVDANNAAIKSWTEKQQERVDEKTLGATHLV